MYVSVKETPRICFSFVTDPSEIWCRFISPLNRIGRSPWSPIQGCLADRGVAAGLFILGFLYLILSLVMIGVSD